MRRDGCHSQSIPQAGLLRHSPASLNGPLLRASRTTVDLRDLRRALDALGEHLHQAGLVRERHHGAMRIVDGLVSHVEAGLVPTRQLIDQ